MSNEGGIEPEKGSIEADFDNSSSAVEDELRARVESAENASINLAIEGGDIGAEGRNKAFVSNSKVRIIFLTFFGVILGACFIFAVVFAAVRLGASEFFRESPEQAKSDGEELLLLSYKEESLLYSLGDKEEKDSGSYLFEDYGLSGDSGQLVITRLSQLNSLQESYNKFADGAVDFAMLLGVNEEFFDSGSVIAVAVEGRYIGSLQTIKLSRDENYGLSINMLRTNLTDEYFASTPQLAGYLNLIKVENVQPKQLTVFIDNNQKEENGNQEEYQE